MAKLDLTGLMTGLPTDQDLRTQGQARAAQIQGGGLGSNLARGIASRAPQREEMMRQGLGGMFGVDTRTGDQQQTARMQQALSGLDLNTPEGLMQLARIQQSTGDMAGAAKSIAAARAQENAKTASATEQKRYDTEQAFEERRVKAAELKAQTAADLAAKEKVYEPKVNVDQTTGNITVISTNPADAGAVISRASTKSEADILVEQNVKAQEKETRIQTIALSANTLAGQLSGVRLALAEAEEASILPLAANLQAQASSPLYGSTIGGNTYKKLENALRAVKSQQALNTIATMKAQSSTGATGLGATNAMEFIALESNIAALDSLVPSSIEAGAQAVERNLQNILLISQGKEPNIDWDLPVYAHMVYTGSNGARTYSYDGIKFYEIEEKPAE